MSGFDRRQFLVYAAVAIGILVIGLVSLKGGSGRGEVPSGATGSRQGPAQDRDGAFTLTGGSRKVVVDVSGAVVRPGVYRLPDGARVIDAIRRAGGPGRDAVVGAINRAARLADGQQVVIPSRAPAPAGATGTGLAPVSAGAAPVSLGTATAEQLEEIDGIGPVTAEKIIEFRNSRGGLGSIEELDQVSGIGPATMESLRSALQP